MTKADAAFAVHNFLEYLQEGDVRLCQLEDGPDGGPLLAEVEKPVLQIVADYIAYKGDTFN